VEDPDDAMETTRSGKPWGSDEIMIMFQMWENGADIAFISETLQRSCNAIYNKLWSMEVREEGGSG
jgi:hypothetical protein